MDKQITPYKTGKIQPLSESEVVYHLVPDELERLTRAFDAYYFDEENARPRHRVRAAMRGRYRMVYLFLRWTGARLSEVLKIDERRGLDLHNAEVMLPTLKRHSKRKKKMKRIVPIPEKLVSEYLMYTNSHLEMEGKVFKIDRTNFYTVFRKLALKTGIPAELAHPHILRHTRAIELLRNGVPVTIVQRILGHASLSTTAVYLRYSSVETKQILKDRGVI